jgi:predicted DNA-binding transcriptional regulator YafY
LRTTEINKSQRMVKILTILIRRRPHKFTVMDIHSILEKNDMVSLRNVQRDLKELSEIPETCICSCRQDGKLCYYIEPDIRNKMSLPLKHNGLLALFLLKRLQPFFAPEASSLEEARDALKELSNEDDYDLFEDLDERIGDSTFVFGEQSLLSLDGSMFNDLLTALVKHHKLEITYRSSDYDNPVKKVICPVKLILFKQELFFVCISEKHDYYIKICRIVTAKLLDQTFEIKPDRLKRIDKRLSKSFGLLDDDNPVPENIELQFPYYFKLILSERKFHATQTITINKKGDTILKMKAPIDRELVQWILGWSDRVKVLKPHKLKEEMVKTGEFLIENNR